MYTHVNHMITMTQIPVETEGYLQSNINTKQSISPHSSIHRTDSDLPRNDFPQSGTNTSGLAEVARLRNANSLTLHQGSRICCAN